RLPVLRGAHILLRALHNLRVVCLRPLRRCAHAQHSTAHPCLRHHATQATKGRGCRVPMLCEVRDTGTPRPGPISTSMAVTAAPDLGGASLSGARAGAAPEKREISPSQ